MERPELAHSALELEPLSDGNGPMRQLGDDVNALCTRFLRGPPPGMLGSVRSASTVAATMALAALGACRERQAAGESAPAIAPAGELVDACAGDSLRPAAAAPAQGLWLYEQPSGARVVAMIGPSRPDDRVPAVTRPVESLEVSATGDTVRFRLDAATVSLEILPPFGRTTLGIEGTADSAVGPHPAATYAPSPRIRLAAYEPCATSARGPRIRYLRRDAAGRIVTDVILHRASEQ